ncbi:MAG: dihydrodipicolinate synthase family protein [Thermoprotei archaeon]|nr:dihydrodipicolinate synthase family protein [Thermoprotei archaeon]
MAGWPTLKGIIPATVCPMNERFEIDEDSLENYIKWITRFRIGGLAVNVDTGEGPHLFPEERVRVLRIVSDVVKGKVPIIAGLPARFTAEAVKLAREAKEAGADALLVFPIPAFIGGDSSEVVYRYHKAIADGADIPLVAFQLQPALGGINYDEETISKLLSIEHVIALKEASFDARRFSDTLRILRSAPRKISLLTGNDNFIFESLVLGADGALIGFGTIGTDLLVEMYELIQKQRYEEAKEIADRLQPLADVIFAPPVRRYRARLKEALVMLGVIEHAYVRPPLLPVSEEERERIRRALKEAGIL